MSDLRHISKALSQYGRNGDTQLVHMHPAEVALLHSITPKGLTQNPDTGLPEAFNFMDILGPIAGIGAAIFAPELLPFIAGASGIGTAIGTGDIGKGIMAGLGSYGAGMGASALGASGLFGGAAGAGEAAASSLPTAAAAATPMSTAGLAGSTTAATAAAAADPALAAAGGMAGGAGGLSGISPYMVHATDAALMNPAIGTIAAPAATNFAAMGSGAGGTLGGIGSWIGDHPMTTAGGLMALSAMAPAGTNYDPAALPDHHGPSQPLVQGPVARPAYMPAGYRPGGPEMSYFPQGVNAAGGLAQPGYADGGAVRNEGSFLNQIPMGLLGAATGFSMGDLARLSPAYTTWGMDIPKAETDADYAARTGGVATKTYAYGGPVQGPGDGTSDDVPATVNGQQPIQLASGEHVIDAATVSHLGNGSNEAGHRVLEAMKRRVRHKKTGRSGMAPDIDPKKYMPQ